MDYRVVIPTRGRASLALDSCDEPCDMCVSSFLQFVVCYWFVSFVVCCLFVVCLLLFVVCLLFVVSCCYFLFVCCHLLFVCSFFHGATESVRCNSDADGYLVFLVLVLICWSPKQDAAHSMTMTTMTTMTVTMTTMTTKTVTITTKTVTITTMTTMTAPALRVLGFVS